MFFHCCMTPMLGLTFLNKILVRILLLYLLTGIACVIIAISFVKKEKINCAIDNRSNHNINCNPLPNWSFSVKFFLSMGVYCSFHKFTSSLYKKPDEIKFCYSYDL